MERIGRRNRQLKIARAEFPGARIEGSGSWASVSECSTQVVHLHQTEALAAKAVDFLDRLGCGGRTCAGVDHRAETKDTDWVVANHYVVPLG
jgi:hypothetical protein